MNALLRAQAALYGSGFGRVSLRLRTERVIVQPAQVNENGAVLPAHALSLLATMINGSMGHRHAKLKVPMITRFTAFLIIGILGLFCFDSRAQENLDCSSAEAQTILKQMLSNQFAPPAYDQIQAIARGQATTFSVAIGTVSTLDQKPLYRQCRADASIVTNGVTERVGVRYSLFPGQANRLLLRIDQLLR